VLRGVVFKYESNPFTSTEVMANVKVFERIDGLTDGQFKTNMPPFGVCTTSCKEMLLCKNVLIALVDWKLYFHHLNYILKPDTHCACLAHNKAMVLTTRIKAKKGISSFP
jgi:hypothetical protein